jgi:hypothetical protein
MALEGQGRMLEYENSRAMIYIPQAVRQDSQWPFEPGQPVRVQIDPEDGKVIIDATEEED